MSTPAKSLSCENAANVFLFNWSIFPAITPRQDRSPKVSNKENMAIAIILFHELDTVCVNQQSVSKC